MRFPISSSRSAHDLPLKEQAAAWLAALSDEDCTAEERRHFARWLKSSNLHVDEFLRISTLTRRLQGATVWPEVDIERLIAEARAETKVTPLQALSASPDKRGPNEIFRRHRTVGLAAVTAVIALGLVIWHGDWTPSRQTYETKLGELRSVALNDGSIVELNAKSSIRTQFTGHERRVKLLSGEAVFRVARNPRRPFKVSTPFAEIVAVGTQFNVDSRANKTIVTVIEGQVKVLSLSESKTSLPVLTAGEQVIVQRERSLKPQARVDPARVTSWTTRRLYFDDTPLAEAASQFERFSERRIRIEDDSLAQRRITASFDASDPRALVQFLERFGDTTVTAVDDGWIIGQSDIKSSAR